MTRLKRKTTLSRGICCSSTPHGSTLVVILSIRKYHCKPHENITIASSGTSPTAEISALQLLPTLSLLTFYSLNDSVCFDKIIYCFYTTCPNNNCVDPSNLAFSFNTIDIIETI